MNKKIDKIYVGGEKEFNARSWENDNCTIDEVIEFFVNAKKEGATHVKWRATTDYDGYSDTCEAETFYNKIESDEEFKERLNEENLKKEKERIEADKKDRETYERLKSRYENKS